VILITQIPFLLTIYYSFFSWNLLKPGSFKFAGLDNYARLVTDESIRTAVWNTVLLTVLVIGISVVIGLAVATLLNSEVFGKGLMRTLMIAPFLIMPRAGALIWKDTLLNPLFGLLPNLLTPFGLGRVDWVNQYPMATVVTVEGKEGEQEIAVVSGLKDLVLLKSTGSEFHDFLVDDYTTLVPTTDRVMATALTARWRYVGADIAWGDAYASVRQHLLEQFATVQSLALQQTLYEMGHAVLEAHPDIAEIRFSAPNKHHFAVDLSPFGLENRNEVFIAADRPYGLIEATVTRDDAPAAGHAWDTIPGFC